MNLRSALTFTHNFDELWVLFFRGLEFIFWFRDKRNVASRTWVFRWGLLHVSRLSGARDGGSPAVPRARCPRQAYKQKSPLKYPSTTDAQGSKAKPKNKLQTPEKQKGRGLGPQVKAVGKSKGPPGRRIKPAARTASPTMGEFNLYRSPSRQKRGHAPTLTYILARSYGGKSRSSFSPLITQ